jgi:group I intron endonuclease
MKEITYIYYLHTGNNIPFYIGKSISPKGRISEHKRNFGNVILEVIDQIPTKEWLFWEKWYIELFKSWGFKLKNKNKGGGGTDFHSETTKQLMSKPKPKGFGEKTTQRLLGKKQSQETIDKRVAKNTGKKRTLEQRMTLSKSFKNRVFSEERNKKIGDAQRGIPQPKSQECIAKLKKPIIQYDKQGNFIKEWDSSTDAGRFYGSNTTIQNALAQRRCKSAYGYIWKYKE